MIGEGINGAPTTPNKSFIIVNDGQKKEDFITFINMVEH